MTASAIQAHSMSGLSILCAALLMSYLEARSQVHMIQLLMAHTGLAMVANDTEPVV